MISASRFYALDAAQSEAIESDFYARLKMRNGTFKLTRPSRFKEAEAAFAPELAKRAGRIREVLDVGVSTGITSLDLYRYLAGLGIDVALTATDLYIKAQIVDLAPGVRVLADGSGWPLQYEVGGVAIRSWTRRLDTFTLLALPLAAARKAALAAIPKAVAEGRARRVEMVTRRVGPGDRITFVENDIFARNGDFARRFDMVRAANILNTGYFPEPMLVKAIGNVRSYLNGPGSLFWVARTDESNHNTATLFELGDDGRFTVVSRLAEGSEIEKLVLAHQPD